MRDEVTLAKMWFSQLWPGYDEAASVWQPVSDIPKFGVWPLIVGTLKVTIVSMAVAVPLGVGVGAVRLAVRARRARARSSSRSSSCSPASRRWCSGFFALIVMATWFQDLFGFESRLNAHRRRASRCRSPSSP